MLSSTIFCFTLVSIASSKDCRFGNGKPAAPGCSGCDKLDPKVISVCSSSGRWEKRKCSDGLKCVFPSGSCSARCEDDNNSGSGGGVVDSAACHFVDGKSAKVGCAGCVRDDSTVISVCKADGKWEKQKCSDGSLCEFKGASCSAVCKVTTTTGTSSSANKTCSFINNKSANPGCGGCVKGDPTLISVCQSNGKWEKVKCASGTLCTFKSGSCSAVCSATSTAVINGTNITSSATTSTTAKPGVIPSTNPTTITTASNSAKATTEEVIEVVDSP